MSLDNLTVGLYITDPLTCAVSFQIEVERLKKHMSKWVEVSIAWSNHRYITLSLKSGN